MTTPQSVLYDIHHKVNEIDRYIREIEDDQKVEDKIDLDDVYQRICRVEDRIIKLEKATDWSALETMAKAVDDRMEKFMDNFKRIENMMLEFKGLVSVARAALPKKKSGLEDLKEIADAL